MPRPAPTTDLGRAIEVLNTWDTFAPDPELIDGPEILGRFLRWSGHPELAADVTDADVEAFRALRARLRMAFEAESEADAVRLLNDLLAEHPVVSELEGVDGGWRFRHRASQPSDVAAALAPECAIALLATIRDRGWDRLGICSASPCTCVYVDQSRNRSRRYCSDLCNDRMSQAAHRRRGMAGPTR
ncbi:MAG: CGNR zinc finger domain-containing protein [Chloroflexota bacterium]|nr:CGNR zinc finger domain-containing protein [Chloroflexota bacterium]